MSGLPIEVSCWLEGFKAKVGLESTVVKVLIGWGLTEHAFDIYKKIEKRFDDALEFSGLKQGNPFRLPEEERLHIREILKEHYLKTRDLPCRRTFREKLHNGFLTGFEELSDLLIGLYEEHLYRLSRMSSQEKAA